MVDVSDDREVTDVGQVGHAWLYGTASGNAAAPSVTGAAGASEDRARRAAKQRPPSPTAAPILAASPPRRAVAPSAFASKASQGRSEEHTSELQSLMRISYDVVCLK